MQSRGGSLRSWEMRNLQRQQARSGVNPGDQTCVVAVLTAVSVCRTPALFFILYYLWLNQPCYSHPASIIQLAGIVFILFYLYLSLRQPRVHNLEFPAVLCLSIRFEAPHSWIASLTNIASKLTLILFFLVYTFLWHWENIPAHNLKTQCSCYHRWVVSWMASFQFVKRV